MRHMCLGFRDDFRPFSFGTRFALMPGMAMQTTYGHRGRRGARVATLLGVLLGGCVVSPQPSPPVHEPILDTGLVGVSGDPMVLRQQVFLKGEPGAVEPAEGVVLVTNLDSADAPVVAEIKADGSFVAAVDASTDQVLRIQVKQGERRSEPVDLQLTGTPIDATRTMAGAPALPLRSSPRRGSRSGPAKATWSSAIRAPRTWPSARRACAAAQGRSGSARRRRSWCRRASPPSSRCARDGEGVEREDVLFLEVTAPEPGRRAVTLTLPD